MSEVRTLLLRCDCQYEYLSVDVWFEDDGYLEISTGRRAGALGDRLKDIWALLRGKDYYYGSVILKPEDRLKFLEFMREE